MLFRQSGLSQQAAMALTGEGYILSRIVASDSTSAPYRAGTAPDVVYVSA
jgi:hypothetical protein